MHRLAIVCAGVVSLLLGLVAPAGAESVEVTRSKGLITRASASYDGAALVAEIDLRRSSRKRADMFVVSIDTGGRRGEERSVYVTADNAEIEDEDLVLVSCRGLVADFRKRAVSVSIPATCLGDANPDRVRVQWAVWWHRPAGRNRPCGVAQLPTKGSSDWLGAAARGC